MIGLKPLTKKWQMLRNYNLLLICSGRILPKLGKNAPSWSWMSMIRRTRPRIWSGSLQCLRRERTNWNRTIRNWPSSLKKLGRMTQTQVSWAPIASPQPWCRSLNSKSSHFSPKMRFLPMATKRKSTLSSLSQKTNFWRPREKTSPSLNNSI